MTNEPDLPAEWQGGSKPENWLDIVVDNYIYDADVVIGEGISARDPGAHCQQEQQPDCLPHHRILVPKVVPRITNAPEGQAGTVHEKSSKLGT